MGAWDFDDAQRLGKATVGRGLRLVGQHQAVAGVRTGDGAARVGVGSYYECEHGLQPQAPARAVNRFSLLFDVRIPVLGPWYCLFQTDPDNASDGDCFVRASSGTVGVGATGYSTKPVIAGRWHRVLVTADHAAGIYRIFLDGERILEGSGQAVDGRLSLAPTLLLFGDEDGEDGVLDVSRVAVYDVCLSEAEAAELGGVGSGDSSNQPPWLNAGAAGPAEVKTGEGVVYRFTAQDPEGSRVSLQVDWGDGSGLSGWSALVASGTPVEMAHTYRWPGIWSVRGLARDETGAVGTWVTVQAVTVSGLAQVALTTAPYLQHVRADGMTIMWEADGLAAAVVEYGTGGTTAGTVTAGAQASGANTWIYRAVLRGLEAGTDYVFRVRMGALEAAGSFSTAPQGEPDFAFAVWGDSQGSNHGSYGADPMEPTKSMFRHMAATGVDLAVTVGDLAENGDAYGDTRQYYLDRVAGLLGSTVPWFVAWGNHDAGPSSVIRRFADLPSQGRAGFHAGYGSYSFDYAGCHFVCLDYASAGADIAQWLEGDLQSAAAQQARFRFLFVHVPPYCELWIDGDSALRSALVPLMERYGVDVCFSGHTHEYSRGFLNGVHYCITGGGSWLDFPEVLVRDWPHMTVGGYHAIDGVTRPGPERGGGLINHYVRVDVRGNSFAASMIGFEPDGTVAGVLDRFGANRVPPSARPQTPVLGGPAEVDVWGGAGLELTCSAFADPDPGDGHWRSVWRLSRTADVQSGAGIELEAITGPGVVVWRPSLAGLLPGRTVYASVQHVSTDGQASAFAPPWAIRLRPDVVFEEGFDSVPEFHLPVGWTAAHRTTVDRDAEDPEDPRSSTYLTWTVVSRERLARVFGANRVNVPEVVRGQSIYAESDHRSGVQLQYLFSPEVDLRGVTNVVLALRSNYMQNQDSMAAVECSLDGGGSWQPVAYFLDGPDVVAGAGGAGVDGVATFTRIDDSGVPTADGRQASGGTYGEHVLARPFEALAGRVFARANDDPTDGKRVERWRLAVADGQSRVRFRLALMGTASWFWGIDDFGLYGEGVEEGVWRVVGVRRVEGGMEVAWEGPEEVVQLQFRSRLGAGAWSYWGEAMPAGQRVVVVPMPGEAGYFRLAPAK